MIMTHFQSTDVDDQETDMLQHGSGLTAAAAAVAYAGALPLIAGAIIAWARPDDLGPRVIEWMGFYGIVLLAFFGGVRWGVAVMTRNGPTFLQLIGAVIPALAALALFAVENVVWTLGILVVLIPILLLDDLRATRRGSGAPAWYLGVRLPLTLMMEVAFIAVLVLAVTQSS